ncbi:uncharacterized protein G2W53_007950 [Senna tora]|uniref:Uncharacterized protein n=1 Tax=Senna tora TaxID=362788 RepID=A0A834X687_9FABA|nr:uncharacterized protein G2W53_007950 [Senna tora]
MEKQLEAEFVAMKDIRMHWMLWNEEKLNFGVEEQWDGAILPY